MPWNTQRPRPLPTAPVRYPTQRRCFATRSTRQCGGAVGGAVSRGHSPPHSSLRGRGVAGRGRPSQALPSPGPGEAKPELRRAGQGSSMHRPRRSRVRSGAERSGKAARPPRFCRHRTHGYRGTPRSSAPPRAAPPARAVRTGLGGGEEEERGKGL